MWQNTITALMIMGLGVLPPELPFDIVPLFGWRAKINVGLAMDNST
jgi:hypothetical protein